ncbi:MAG TPA: diacylglycerol kinase family protein [Chloroflexota bacterium]|nr:diacylglycerol kinase family protein [Chloroflexota bacterium]
MAVASDHARIDPEDREAPSHPYDRIAVIVNPAAGQDRPILGVLNRAFHTAKVDWEVYVTKKANDAADYARRAVEERYPVIAVYGGDGTVGEVASALVGTGVPLAIFPGGTANVMSVELGIPSDLAEACALVFSGAGKARSIDVGRIRLPTTNGTTERYFMLRVGIGFEAEMVEGADRELKDKFGTLAYALSALQALREPSLAHYRLTLDGAPRETRGMTCIIANTGSLGRTNLTLAPDISVSDGKLDVVVVRSGDLPSLLSVAAKVLTGSDPAEPLQHWQASSVRVEVEPAQAVTVDGEMVEVGPIEVDVLPAALNVIVPVSAEGVNA